MLSLHLLKRCEIYQATVRREGDCRAVHHTHLQSLHARGKQAHTALRWNSSHSTGAGAWKPDATGQCPTELLRELRNAAEVALLLSTGSAQC